MVRYIAADPPNAEIRRRVASGIRHFPRFALILSAIGAWVAGALPADFLRAGFGVFLIALGVVGGYRALKND